MTRKQFTALYCFRVRIVNTGTSINIRTELIRKSDNQMIDWVDSTHNINDTNDLMDDVQINDSMDGFDWTYLIGLTKRWHLDHFARKLPIDDFFPLNPETEIDSLYCNQSL